MLDFLKQAQLFPNEHRWSLPCRVGVKSRDMTDLRLGTSAFQADGSRINVNSVDNSTNLISESNTVLFARMREQATAIEDATDREDIVARVAELEKAQGSSGFFHAYQNFIASAANHMTLFAPFLPALAELLHHAK